MGKKTDTDDSSKKASKKAKKAAVQQETVEKIVRKSGVKKRIRITESASKIMTKDAYDYLSSRCPEGRERDIRDLGRLPKLMSFLFWDTLVLVFEAKGKPLTLQNVKDLIRFETHLEDGVPVLNDPLTCSLCKERFWGVVFYDPAQLIPLLKKVGTNGDVSFASLLDPKTLRGVRHPPKDLPANFKGKIEWRKLCGAPFNFSERKQTTEYDDASCYGQVGVRGAEKKLEKLAHDANVAIETAGNDPVKLEKAIQSLKNVGELEEKLEFLWGCSAERQQKSQHREACRQEHRQKISGGVDILVDSIV